jgi:cytoskeletal protein CcmA (bactofilin family)
MTETKPRESSSALSSHHPAILGRSALFRGELSGNEDLLLEGQVEGNISLEDHCLTVGPSGQVKGEIRARQVVIHGSVQGNVSAREKIEIHKTGHVGGDLLTAAIVIAEGGYFKGSIDIVGEGSRPLPRAGAATRTLAAEPKAREGFEMIPLSEGPGIDR